VFNISRSNLKSKIDIKELSIRLDDIGKSNWFMKNIGYSILRKN